MSLLKQRIMDSAMRLIFDKGYMATSIQDIANDCGIAKGSVYKFFESKEDLLIEVYGSRIQRMYDQAETIKADETLSPRDRLIRQTRHQFDFFEDMKFSLKDMQELPIGDDKKFAAACQVWRGRQLEYYKDILIAAYGQKIESSIWDLVIVYSSFLKVLSMFPSMINQPLNHEHAAKFIVERMDDMTAGLAKTKLAPLFPAPVMEEYARSGHAEASVTTEKRRTDLFETLIASVQELTVPHGRKEELIEAARQLQEEAEKVEPKRILIRVLLEFLQSQHELKSLVSQLNKLLD